MLLAGFLLSCFLQLAATQQQETFSVILQPGIPKEGQDVTLSLRGGPHQFTQCQWSRGGAQFQSSNIILTYYPAGTPPLINGSAHRGRETVHQDCSLQIKKLRRQDTGRYYVRKTTGPIQQQGDSSQIQGQVYETSVFIPVSVLTGSNQINLTITTEPRFPSQNQHVTLTPKGAPREFYYCQWFRQTRFGSDDLIQTYIPGERQQSSQQKREVIKESCSLIISNLTTSDTGSYIVKLEAPFDQQQQAQKGNEENQLYFGHVNLQVSEQSKTNPDPHQSGSSSLSYNGGIIALVLLGSFSWLDPLMNIFTMFFSSLASLKPRFLS